MLQCLTKVAEHQSENIIKSEIKQRQKQKQTHTPLEAFAIRCF